MNEDFKSIIEKAWDDRSILHTTEVKEAINAIIDQLDKGELRVAEPTADGWKINEWVKKAIVMYFPIRQMSVSEVGIFEFHDKMKLKNIYLL